MAILWLAGQVPSQATQVPIRATVVLDSVDSCKNADNILRVNMEIRLHIENLNAGAVIVGNDWSEGGWRILTRDAALGQNTDWVSLDIFTSGDSQELRLGATPGPEFRVLKPRGALTRRVKGVLLLNPPTEASSVRLQLAVRSPIFFSWTEQDVQEATQKWAAVGALWTEGVNTEPFTMFFDPKTERNCTGK